MCRLTLYATVLVACVEMHAGDDVRGQHGEGNVSRLLTDAGGSGPTETYSETKLISGDRHLGDMFPMQFLTFLHHSNRVEQIASDF